MQRDVADIRTSKIFWLHLLEDFARLNGFPETFWIYSHVSEHPFHIIIWAGNGKSEMTIFWQCFQCQAEITRNPYKNIYVGWGALIAQLPFAQRKIILCIDFFHFLSHGSYQSFTYEPNGIQSTLNVWIAGRKVSVRARVCEYIRFPTNWNQLNFMLIFAVSHAVYLCVKFHSDLKWTTTDILVNTIEYASWNNHNTIDVACAQFPSVNSFDSVKKKVVTYWIETLHSHFGSLHTVWTKEIEREEAAGDHRKSNKLMVYGPKIHWIRLI